MMTKSSILRSLKQYKQQFGAQYGIKELGLFGSVARNEHTDASDVDVCIRLEKPDFFTRMTIRDELSQLLGLSVDVVSLAAVMRPLFKQQLQKDVIFV